jgi:signal transduction histidine kinase
MQAQVLVVDDNRELAENVCELLEGIGEHETKCYYAESAKEALRRAQDLGATLDLVFIDLRLPDSDGIELLRRIKALQQDTQVILMTGHATVESAAAAVDSGAFAFVLKPFRSSEFMLIVRRALDQAAQRRERQELLHRLELSERRHREVVEAIPALVLALDERDNIMVYNRHLEQLTGFARHELLGRPGRSLIGERGGERRLVTRSGGQRMIRWQCTTVEGPSGVETTYAMGIDVTDERQMLRRTLRAERLAAVGTLAAGLAHEVRNPLNSANLQLQVLKRRLGKGQLEAASAAADLVVKEIERLDHLVSDFLAFARPQPLQTQKTDPNRLVSAVWQLMKPEAEARSVQLVLELADPIEAIDIEEERMRQVLLNLARNAIEATEGESQVVLRTKAADTAGEVCIEVEDDGPGFPEEAPIFDAFYTTKQQGTGLGLAIAHRIVSDHGGTLSVVSRPGCTRFTVFLPLHTELAPSARA